MANVTWIDVQTRLLSDGELRARFKSNPAITAKELGLDHGELDLAISVDSESLERQAALLIHKRYHHVKQILPWTFQKLAKRAYSQFEEYAGLNWPSGVQYHMHDAEGFLEWLMKNPENLVSRAERNRLLFSRRSKRFALYFVSDFFVRNKWRGGLQIFIRFHIKCHELVVHLP